MMTNDTASTELIQPTRTDGGTTSVARLTDLMVVGFAYCDGEVLLIEKMRPEWQRGYMNGVGGHIEEGERPCEAMRREFREETAMDTSALQWVERVRLLGCGWQVLFFRAWLDRVERDSVRMTTDEEPVWVPMNRLWSLPVLPNLRWLVPLCYDPDIDAGELITMRDVR